MELMIHIFIALGSIAYTTYLFLSPSRNKFYISYALVFSTILSGTYLTLIEPVLLVHACTMGLIYISAVLLGTVLAGKKLARQQM